MHGKWNYSGKEIQRFLMDWDYQMRVMSTLYEVETLFPRVQEEEGHDLSSMSETDY